MRIIIGLMCFVVGFTLIFTAVLGAFGVGEATAVNLLVGLVIVIILTASMVIVSVGAATIIPGLDPDNVKHVVLGGVITIITFGLAGLYFSIG